MNRWRPVPVRPTRRAAFMPVDEPGAPEPPPVAPPPADPLESDSQSLRLAFAPLHKRAFGTAIGFAAAVLLFALTAFHILVRPGGPNLELLDHYFRGYSLTWVGAFIGAAWAFGVGFVGGWFFAFCRNLAIAISIFLTRTKAELAETREFLDHI